MNNYKLPLLLSLTLLASACDSQPTAAPAAPAAPSPAAGTAPAEVAASESAAAEAAAALSVVQWGPEKTQVGKPFNVQPNGNSGMWFKMSSVPPPSEYAGTIGGKPMGTVVANGDIVAGTVPPDYLATPGSYPVVLTITTTGQKFEVGNFVVE